jgi:hypothetical protein
MKYRFPFTLLICCVAHVLLTPDCLAIADEDNMGQWTKPVNKGPDAEVPGFLINLGPTGARAVLKPKSLVVKHIFARSPASGKLHIDDEIVGVNGKAFEKEHVFGKHYFKHHDIGYEGPMMDFGTAIEDSDAQNKPLVVDVLRKGTKQKVTIRLPAVGGFSKTYPYNCSKSDKLAKAALDYILDSPDRFKGQVHQKGTVGLALLAHGKMKEAKELAHSWNKPPGGNMWTWPTSYQCIFLCEYYLKTKDKEVLDTIGELVKILYRAQVTDPALWKDHMHNGHNQANNFLHGGLGHVVSIDGYGTMSITTLLAMISWELAKACGVEVKQKVLDDAYACIQTNTHDSGYMGYRHKGGAYSGVGRQGLSIIAHRLSGMKTSDAYLRKVSHHLGNSGPRLNDGHGDNVLSLFWGLLGVLASQDKTAIRAQLDYNKALLNLARTHDGSFVALPGRNTGDKGYYMSPRLHFTAAMALVLTMDNPILRLQGAGARAIPSEEGEPSKGMRTWTDHKGRTVDGTLHAKTGEALKIRTAAGKIVTLPIKRLSKADQAFVRGR